MYIRFQLVRGNIEEKKEWQIPAGEEGLASLRSGWDTTHHRKGSGGPGQPEGRGPVGRRLAYLRSSKELGGPGGF